MTEFKYHSDKTIIYVDRSIVNTTTILERPSISRAGPELRAGRKVGRVPSVARPAPARADTASTEVLITLDYQ